MNAYSGYYRREGSRRDNFSAFMNLSNRALDATFVLAIAGTWRYVLIFAIDSGEAALHAAFKLLVVGEEAFDGTGGLAMQVSERPVEEVFWCLVPSVFFVEQVFISRRLVAVLTKAGKILAERLVISPPCLNPGDDLLVHLASSLIGVVCPWNLWQGSMVLGVVP